MGRDSPAVEFAALGEAHTGVLVMSQGIALGPGQYFALFRVVFFFSIICDVVMDGAAQCPNCVIKEDIALFLGFPLFQPHSFD